jgi:hypothetical protein
VPVCGQGRQTFAFSSGPVHSPEKPANQQLTLLTSNFSILRISLPGHTEKQHLVDMRGLLFCVSSTKAGCLPGGRAPVIFVRNYLHVLMQCKYVVGYTLI